MSDTVPPGATALIVMPRAPSSGAHRRGQHDPPALGKVPGRVLGREQLPAHVRVVDPVELLGRDRLQRAEVLDARVADENVQASQPVHGLVDQPPRLLRVRHVGLECHRRAAGRHDLRRDRLGRRRAVHIVDGDRRPVAGQPAGHSRADAPRTARDQCDFSLEAHCFSPQFVTC
jgi:hypothetical protein